MSKKFAALIAGLCIIAIVLSAVALVIVTNPKADIQYVLYLGTNDKDTNQPVFPPEEAMEQAKKILINIFGGYTIQEAKGGWVDGDKVYQEYTLVIYLSDTTLDKVHEACDVPNSTLEINSYLLATTIG